MPTFSKKTDFFATEEGLEFERILRLMVADNTYNTDPSYSANGELYPDHLIPFINKHMDYMRCHPMIDPSQYLANLRLMTRVR